MQILIVIVLVGLALVLLPTILGVVLAVLAVLFGAIVNMASGPMPDDPVFRILLLVALVACGMVLFGRGSSKGED